MASHLTITSAAPATMGGKGTGNQQDKDGGLMGIFSALLNGGPDGSERTTKAEATGQSRFDFNLANLLKLGADAGDAADGEAPDPEALAAALGGPVQMTSPVTPQPLVDFIDALSALKSSLESGQPLDPDLLGKVSTSLDGLADALGLDLDQLDVPDDFTALLGKIDSDTPDLANTLASMLAPLANALSGAQPATTADTLSSADATQDLLKSIGDKLATMIAALEEGDVSADKLKALGMGPGQPIDKDIEAALARFADGIAPADVPDQPALAKPSLEVTDPALSGKAPADLAGADAKAGGKDGAKDRDDSTPPKAAHEARTERRDVRADFAVNAPAATDASNNPVAPGTTQPAGARVDAAANPRIVQTGYQTSQQQLNLPQIAFELGRQVTDGNTRFQIRLDPAELGKIDVRLDIDQSGQVNARLTVEKAETLDLMQRDQRGLEKALQQAGLDAGKTNLEFSLKQNPFAGSQGQNQQHPSGGESGFALAGLVAEEADPAPPTVNLYRGSLVASGVNIIA